MIYKNIFNGAPGVHPGTYANTGAETSSNRVSLGESSHRSTSTETTSLQDTGADALEHPGYINWRATRQMVPSSPGIQQGARDAPHPLPNISTLDDNAIDVGGMHALATHAGDALLLARRDPFGGLGQVLIHSSGPFTAMRGGYATYGSA